MGLSTITDLDEQERNEENRLKGTNTEFGMDDFSTSDELWESTKQKSLAELCHKLYDRVKN